MSREIGDLDPELRPLARRFLDECRACGLSVFITHTLRSFAEQEALYAQGREDRSAVNALRRKVGWSAITDDQNVVVTRARPGHSWHNFGLAFDVALRDPRDDPHWDVQADYNDNDIEDYAEIGRIGERLGLMWGGRWRKPDYGHFQLHAGSPPEIYRQSHPIYGRNDMIRLKIKPGVLTTEFWMTVAAHVLAVALAVLGAIEAQWAAAAMTIIQSIYTYMRGQVKQLPDLGVRPKAGFKTTEFWMTLGGHAANLAMAALGLLQPQWAGLASSVIQAVYTHARGRAKSTA